MVTSSGFRCSPGHAAFGNVACIAPMPPHGHQNGLQRRCICSSSLPLLSDQIVAKRPCYGQFKLTPSYDINLVGVISLSIHYWPSLSKRPSKLGTFYIVVFCAVAMVAAGAIWSE